jgi:hypothetical protein
MVCGDALESQATDQDTAASSGDSEAAGMARFWAAADQLAKRHQIQVGKETLRGCMIAAGIWRSSSRVPVWPIYSCCARIVVVKKSAEALSALYTAASVRSLIVAQGEY